MFKTTINLFLIACLINLCFAQNGIVEEQRRLASASSPRLLADPSEDRG